jgi:hypothetical protein
MRPGVFPPSLPAESAHQAASSIVLSTLGKLMIIKLRADWTKSRGGRKSWKPFHDEFLSRGGPPIPLIRKAMLGPADKSPLLHTP